MEGRVCTRCVMDTSAVNIHFDENGRCQFCTEYLSQMTERLSTCASNNRLDLDHLLVRVREASRRSKYDCVVGLSGGVDSSWALLKAVELGLRPLAVHMDNGWNSELAQNNIGNLVKALDVDLITHVIEWDEYRQLMQSFFDADVIDVELLYDNAMLKVNFKQAYRWRARSILSGSNHATEGMTMPQGWNWFKYDKRNIVSIAASQSVKISSFPAIGTIGYTYYSSVGRVSWISFLDYLDYHKESAITELENRFGFKRYPYKHYESVFTRFYQGYLLPKKFGIDKRRLHLSNLIVSGQLDRDEALDILKSAPYPSSAELERDIEYFLKKMRWKPAELDDYLRRPGRPHDDFRSETRLYRSLQGIAHHLRQSARMVRN